ncbi:3-hydroxyacyl-CoA dehydrogenase NAD-binding domain-containing protein [Embleya sp. NPDC059259]|uniref:3-hydroxyacyl-CoA dehydrogenase NAD-binding domain-containing protein n=1 Tax=unclassified Embleya TaxID=2699296 RepID=UPI0036816929
MNTSSGTGARVGMGAGVGADAGTHAGAGVGAGAGVRTGPAGVRGSAEAAGIARVAIVGTGVIGASWAAHFLARGLDVVATDPAPGAEERLRADVAALQPTLAGGSAGGARPARLTFTADAAEAAAEADFIQENGPEREDVKRALFARLDAAARPGVVLAGSSSGLATTVIARDCVAHPERVLIGHPFNPPHLIPLVEVVPGENTGEDAVRTALAFYTSVGKKPIRLRRELPGHLANRLQAALWREAYSLVDRGAATVADIDTAIAYGPGLRWAILGPFANQHLSGGPGGIAHVLAHLGPPTEAWWRDLGDPSLTPELTAKLVAGVAEALAGVDDTALAARRDALLSLLLAAKADADLP